MLQCGLESGLFCKLQGRVGYSYTACGCAGAAHDGLSEVAGHAGDHAEPVPGCRSAGRHWGHAVLSRPACQARCADVSPWTILQSRKHTVHIDLCHVRKAPQKTSQLACLNGQAPAGRHFKRLRGAAAEHLRRCPGAGLDGAGAWSIGLQWGSLALTLIMSSALAQPAGMHVLAWGLVASRFGLWAFDLAVSQMLQERVPSEQLGAALLSSIMDTFLTPLLNALLLAAGT